MIIGPAGSPYEVCSVSTSTEKESRLSPSSDKLERLLSLRHRECDDILISKSYADFELRMQFMRM